MVAINYFINLSTLCFSCWPKSKVFGRVRENHNYIRREQEKGEGGPFLKKGSQVCYGQQKRGKSESNSAKTYTSAITESFEQYDSTSYIEVCSYINSMVKSL